MPRRTKRNANESSVEIPMPKRLFVTRCDTHDDDEYDPTFKVSETSSEFAGQIGTSQRVAVYELVGFTIIETTVHMSEVE